jgi:hypothetical protein
VDKSALVNPQIQAGEWLIKEFAKRYPVKAAFWLKSDEDEDWYLYVASDKVNDTNLGAAYGDVSRIMSTSRNPWLNPFRVKVVGADDPLARAIIKFTKNHPGETPILVNAGTLDDVWIEGAIVYPPPMPRNPATLGTA